MQYKSALPTIHLQAIQRGTMRYKWKGRTCNKNPFDLALYPMLFWTVQPRTIIEIGTKAGGGALWMADICHSMGLDTHIVTIDINKRDWPTDPRVTFLTGDGRDLGRVLTDNMLANLPRPLIVIEDADHHYITTLAVLRFMDRHLQPGEYIVIEDGIIDSLFNDVTQFGGGPNRAIEEFIAERNDYWIDRSYCDYFGQNVTWNTNGYLRRLPPVDTV